jgi:hypothetical protein
MEWPEGVSAADFKAKAAKVAGQDQATHPPSYSGNVPIQSSGGRTAIGEVAPDDRRNSLQRNLDNLSTPDARKEEWQGPVRTGIDRFSQGVASSVLPMISHPIQSGIGIIKSLGNAMSNSGGTAEGFAREFARPIVEGAVQNYVENGPAKAIPNLVGQGVGGWAAGELGGAGTKAIVKPIAARVGPAMQTLAEENLNRRMAPSTNDTSYGQNPGRGVLASGIGPSTRQGLLRKIGEAKESTGEMIGNAVRGADSNANAPLLSSKKLASSIDGPISGRIAEVTGPGRATASPEVPYQIFREGMQDAAPGATAPIYGPNAPENVLPSDLWKTTRNIDKNTRFNPDPEIESANEIKRNVRGGLRRQLETVDPNIKPLSQNYGDLSSSETAIERENSPMFRASGIRGILHDTLDSYPVNTAVSSGIYKAGGMLKRIGGIPESPMGPNWTPRVEAVPHKLEANVPGNADFGDDFTQGRFTPRPVRTGQAPPSRLALPDETNAGEAQPMVGVLKHPGQQRSFTPPSDVITAPGQYLRPEPTPSQPRIFSPEGIRTAPRALLPGGFDTPPTPEPTTAHIYPAGSQFRAQPIETPVYPPASQFRGKAQPFNIDEYLKGQ